MCDCNFILTEAAFWICHIYVKWLSHDALICLLSLLLSTASSALGWCYWGRKRKSLLLQEPLWKQSYLSSPGVSCICIIVLTLLFYWILSLPKVKEQGRCPCAHSIQEWPLATSFLSGFCCAHLSGSLVLQGLIFWLIAFSDPLRTLVHLPPLHRLFWSL